LIVKPGGQASGMRGQGRSNDTMKPAVKAIHTKAKKRSEEGKRAMKMNKANTKGSYQAWSRESSRESRCLPKDSQVR